jgi:ubiquitin-protein ligase
MISFSCPSCGRSFAVPESAAGRRAKCNGCGTELAVPSQSTRAATLVAPTVGAGAPKMAPRTRRLTAEHEQLMKAFADFDAIRIRSTIGFPPEAYEIEYYIKSFEPGPLPTAQPTPRDMHRVKIELTSDYPRLSPRCKMLTPIFHPNFDEATICIGDHWTAGERLVDLVIRIGEMIAFQAYNIKSPLNGEAAMWADLNSAKLPSDPRNLRPPALD